MSLCPGRRRELRKVPQLTFCSILVLGSFLGMNVHPDIVLLIVRLYLLVNIATALYPLFRRKDEISDIPLTPSQRALLGLDPSSTPPATPGTTYITPPRYRLSSGPRKPSPLSPSSSPLSGRGSPSGGGQPYEGALYSPSPSPLFQRAVAGGNRDMMRRNSFGSSSPFGRSPFRESGSLRIPSTPSPSAGKNANVLTNKWLYEKTRAVSPGGSVLGR